MLRKILDNFQISLFDYVILSQTLQAFLNPEKVINELLRIGKQAIVPICDRKVPVIADPLC